MKKILIAITIAMPFLCGRTVVARKDTRWIRQRHENRVFDRTEIGDRKLM